MKPERVVRENVRTFTDLPNIGPASARDFALLGFSSTHEPGMRCEARPSNQETTLTHTVLFGCGKNRLRSPTAEQVFAGWPGIETASAGRGRDCPLSAELLAWADTGLVMEATHRAKIAARFPAQLRGTRVAVPGIADLYDYMAPERVRLLRAKVPRHLPPAAGAAADARG